jgi:4-diphosphocytidyl-2-C-methyl-D-erythritol kinase
VIIFSNCKINLGLKVLRKRADGYHDLETVFYPVRFVDVIEAIRTTEGDMQFTSTGIEIDSSPQQNLCMKAYALLKQSYDIPPMQLHLHKAIPSGAGLGGGSANAAFTLKLLNTKFNLGLSTETLLDLALQLGSDCPFFIVNKPCIATGRGEILERIELPTLHQYYLAIINPGIHVSTAWAFSQVTPRANAVSIKDIVTQPISNWKSELINDFEDAVCNAHPRIKEIKEMMYNNGAAYASMSGSGSSVFGLFDKPPKFDGDYEFIRIIGPEKN